MASDINTVDKLNWKKTVYEIIMITSDKFLNKLSNNQTRFAFRYVVL